MVNYLKSIITWSISLNDLFPFTLITFDLSSFAVRIDYMAICLAEHSSKVDAMFLLNLKRNIYEWRDCLQKH